MDLAACINCCNSPNSADGANSVNLADPSSSSSQPLPVSLVPMQLSLYEPEESEQEMIIAEEIVVVYIVNNYEHITCVM